MINNKLITTAIAIVALSACKQSQSIKPVVIDHNCHTHNEEMVENIVYDFESNIGDRVYFNYNSSDVSQAAKENLDKQIHWLKEHPNVRVILEGHTDQRGTNDYNFALGERRANSVRNYLKANGIHDHRMEVISYGKKRPAEIGSNEEAWAKNRRVVTVVYE